MAEASKVSSKASAMQKQGEFGYPLGHIGHLNSSQESALVEFKELCAKHGVYKPAKDGHAASHDDALMLRFLRARRFVPADAYTQFKETEQWREINKIDQLYYNIDVDNYDEARRLYPQWTGRRDKRGIPVYLFKVKPLDTKVMATYAKSTVQISVADEHPPPTAAVAADAGKEKANDRPVSAGKASDPTPPRLLRLFALYENLAGFMVELCSLLRDRPYPDTPITQSNNIVDISGVGLKQFWNLRSHMQDASVLATAHYPETLDRIFIVGAPSFFPTVWSWIKRWFDPITVSKIFILSAHDAYRTLSAFIEPESIPRRYGGQLDFDFGQYPAVDPAYADRLTWRTPAPEKGPRQWPRGPVAWQARDDGGLDMLLVGSVQGKARREVVATFWPEKPAPEVSDQAPAAAAAAAVPAVEDESKSAAATEVLLKASQDPGGIPPVEQTVEPVPLAATATELPKEKAEQASQPVPLANGQV